MNNEEMHNIFMSPATVGLTGAAASMMLISSSNKLYGLPAPFALGLAIGGASMVSATMKETVYEKFLGDNESELLYSATTPVLTGLASVAMFYGLVGKNMSKEGAFQMFLLGGASELIGERIHDSLMLL